MSEVVSRVVKDQMSEMTKTGTEEVTKEGERREEEEWRQTDGIQNDGKGRMREQQSEGRRAQSANSHCRIDDFIQDKTFAPLCF